MARRRESASFQDAKRWIRKNFPSEYTVRIQLVDRKINKGFDGLINVVPSKGEDYLIVRISNDMNISQTLETLWHEWSHVLTWHSMELDEKNPHPDVFWAHYGRIYRKWHGEPS